MKKIIALMLSVMLIFCMLTSVTCAYAELIETKPGDGNVVDKEDEFDDTIAQGVIDIIDDLPDTIKSLDDKDDIAAVEAARAAYEKLTEAQKAFVDNLDKLTGLESDIIELKAAADDAAAAAAVEKMISDLGEITSLDQKEAVESARAAFDKLTETQQGLVKNENVLKDAEAAIEKLENPDKPVIKGDVDDNGTVNVSDIMTLKNLIMSSSWTPEQLERGDMDDNGTLTVGDMLSIKSIIMAG